MHVPTQGRFFQNIKMDLKTTKLLLYICFILSLLYIFSLEQIIIFFDTCSMVLEAIGNCPLILCPTQTFLEFPLKYMDQIKYELIFFASTKENLTHLQTQKKKFEKNIF